MHFLQIRKYGDFEEDTVILINYTLIIGVTLHTSLQVWNDFVPIYHSKKSELSGHFRILNHQSEVGEAYYQLPGHDFLSNSSGARCQA